ncbi:MAG: hypothetical protein LAT68_05685 [Cyclobacteriaceae bacterium]|nr:hypothetical protein [Cyclobacteriaceae bacterium]MCH8515803.1 hypothetical protein [Cyclobacteriaceae bacterium]
MIRYIQIVCIFSTLLCCACSLGEGDEDVFSRLFGGGSRQQAVDFLLDDNQFAYIVGNERLSNNDSTAVLVIKTNELGVSLNHSRFFGLGRSEAEKIVSYQNERFVLFNTRESLNSQSFYGILRLDAEGEIIQEIIYMPNEEDNNIFQAKDLVFSSNGEAYVLGNLINGTQRKLFIDKLSNIDFERQRRRVFSNSNAMQAFNLVWLEAANELIAVGSTTQIAENTAGRNLFLAAFSENLVEIDQRVYGSMGNDDIQLMQVVSDGRIEIFSKRANNEEPILTKWSIRPRDLNVIDQINLSVDADVVAYIERGTQIFIGVEVSEATEDRDIRVFQLNDLRDIFLQEPILNIGGQGSDQLNRMLIEGNHLYILKTLDFRNENSLIGLSKVEF